MSGARVGVVRRLQLWLIDRLRASRIWPVGLADKRADTHRLEQALNAEVVVFFPTGADSLYQLRPWLKAFETLNETHRVSIVFRDSRAAAVVRRESNLDCLTIARYGQLDAIFSRSNVKLVLYVNHDPINFECLRFTSMLHVYVGHGDSDKGVSVSNQVKAYDYCFLAGQAAIDRTSTSVMAYPAADRSILIGQPQLDSDVVATHPDPERKTVLYAPTWEASQPSVSYGSLITHGLAIMRALRGTYRVIYRPHPLNGVIDSAYGEVDSAVRALADRVDTDVPLAQSFADADVLITDVSAVALNWLPNTKPLVITKPRVPIPPSRLMETLPLMEAGADFAAIIAEHLSADPTAAARAELIEYYLGDTTPGVATTRFVSACTDVIARRDVWWSERQANGATGP